jgi:NhaA family Na+:H+ antiporter
VNIEAISGIVLLGAAVAAVLWANSPWAPLYERFLHTHLSLSIGAFHLEMDAHEAINDGLMTFFFFVVGMEIKREVRTGQLRNPRAAALPVAGALGGMIAPALIYAALQGGTPAAAGWGIPMATDIAFAVGVLSILGRRVPRGLRIFLLALAIADDLGAIVVIAVFYTEGLNLLALAWAAAGLGFVVLLQRAGVWAVPVYAAVGVAVWFGFLESGVHPTIAGVLLGFLTPMRPRLPAEVVRQRAQEWAQRVSAAAAGPVEERWEELARGVDALERDALTPMVRLEDRLHVVVAFVIMPLFALANAGVHLSLGVLADQSVQGVALAVAIALVAGKPLGILAFSAAAVGIRVARLPEGVDWRHLAAAGVLGGIGFTVSLFIAHLSFGDGPLLDGAKMGILLGSLVAALLGVGVLLWATLTRRVPAV